MKHTYAIAFALSLSPLAALAMPVVGDVVGTNAEAATAVLEAAGCPAQGFELEDGMIEAQCTETATGKVWDLYIDPKTGAIAEIRASDD